MKKAMNFQSPQKEERSVLLQSLRDHITTIIFAVLFFLALLLLIHPASGDVVRGAPDQNAKLEYHQEGLKNNPLELYVSQGDRIYQGKTYDLSRVTGISYQYAHWNNWKDEDFTCTPDQIIDIWHIRTGINENAVQVNWPLGNWYYWDWWECNLTHYDYSTQKTVQATTPLQNDNKLAFTVINPPYLPTLNNPIKEGFIPVPTYVSAYATPAVKTAMNR